MSRSQILIVVAAIALVAAMFFLPKVIVSEKDTGTLAKSETAPMAEGHSADDGHGHEAEASANGPHAEASPEQLQELATARAKYNKAADEQGRIQIASQLAEAYFKASKYDSAGYYYQVTAEARPGETTYKKAGDSYYEAFTFAPTQERANELGAKARDMYAQVLKNNPANLDAKTNVAMTYIATSSPMQGITLLREVISADPDNEKALFNLGVLSMQSNQYDKAAERFQKLVDLNPANVEATFYLGVSLAKMGQREEARTLLNKVKTMSDDPALSASVDEALLELNK